MAVLKCKMCGGSLKFSEGSTAQCEFCGSVQTVPKADDEKKISLFARANRLRAACDFDKAETIYEAIIADFPEEAEAYWGLVLCKYGIEYVDDPATGKKIPTCHRSNFDSVMDDSNFEQALENADVEAQRIYREEAKQFERLRKDIIQVSATAEAYDIFICYKETNEKGDRTLDSVLAQDLYSALTDKGYKVFFSRISLRGKLGEAYEPYIFAALNSAKVMLAVGTCYEHYNAVWVKNEWSRYLKLCRADAAKHLIPCYRDIDPEDMPREFNHLQGADLGKMGAVQDILFNMEKYIPLRQEKNVHETIFVTEVSQQKIASLLDRGRMALEDGDFANADGFYEEVLNCDSRNARAYLGKFLANQRCGSLESYKTKSLGMVNTSAQTRNSLQPDQEHIDRIVAYYGNTFARKYDLQKLYRFDLTYMSCLPHLRKLQVQELQRWEEDKLLTKAVQFADGDFADELHRVKTEITEALADNIRTATEQEQTMVADLQARYNDHVAAIDRQAALLYEQELANMELRYNELMAQLQNANSQRSLRNLAEDFDKLGSFREAKDQAVFCREKALHIDYEQGIARMKAANSEREFMNLSQYFEKLDGYENSSELVKYCIERAQAVRLENEQIKQREAQKRITLSHENRQLARITVPIYLVLSLMLLFIGVVGLADTMGGLAIGAVIGAVAIQAVIYVLPLTFLLLQAANLGKKDKLATAFRIAAMVVSGISLLVWAIVCIILWSIEGFMPITYWALSIAGFNLLSLLFTFIRKR